MSKKEKHSLAEKIAGILTTAPSSFDPEDEPLDATTAQVFDDEDVLQESEEEEILSNLRKGNIDLLADVDNKYAGKRTSRLNIKEDSSEGESEDDNLSNNDDEHIGFNGKDYENDIESEEVASDDDDDDNDDDDDENDGESEEMASGSDDDDENDGESEEMASGSDDADEISDEELEEEEDNEYDEETFGSVDFSNGNRREDNFKHINDENTSAQFKKALSVQNQTNIWENLLEIRIQLQKCLTTANKMPQKEIFNEIKKQSGSDFTSKVTETKVTVSRALDKLLTLQKLLLRQYPETKNLECKGITKSEDLSDEEIPSDTDPEESEHEESEEETTEVVNRRKRKLEDFEQEISDCHKKYKDYRNTVILKWNDKTRVGVKSDTPSHSILNHIESCLNNKEKLIKRTQLKRSQYNIVGETLAENETEEYNTEIFDDGDFYHQQLRELIEVKSASITDPVQLGKQWVQLQSIRNKMKKKVDTRATKGRKIKYLVRSKLVNFMNCMDRYKWNDEAKNELFSSLYGKNQPIFTSS